MVALAEARPHNLSLHLLPYFLAGLYSSSGQRTYRVGVAFLYPSASAMANVSRYKKRSEEKGFVHNFIFLDFDGFAGC